MPRLAHFGTFDVENYGDLLFPLLIERALPEMEIVHVSPVGGRPLFTDARPAITVQDASRERFDGVAIGGGNILNAGARVVSDYRRVRYSAYPSLWAGAATLARSQKVPLVVNASGVAPFGAFAFLAPRALNGCNYLAVRDAPSREILVKAGVSVPINVVPDTAIRLPDVWEAEDLADEYKTFVGHDGRTIACHVNRRYVTTASDTARHLDRIAQAVDARPVLVAIGRCHGDHHVIADVAAEMASHPLVLDRPQSLRQVAALIAHSIAYVGSSMHGAITACAYERPALVVAGSTPLAKFSGFLSHVDAKERLVPAWSNVTGHESALSVAVDPRPAQIAVSQHWEQLRAALGRRPAAAGSPLLHAWRPLVEIGGRTLTALQPVRERLRARRLVH